MIVRPSGIGRFENTDVAGPAVTMLNKHTDQVDKEVGSLQQRLGVLEPLLNADTQLTAWLGFDEPNGGGLHGGYSYLNTTTGNPRLTISLRWRRDGSRIVIEGRVRSIAAVPNDTHVAVLPAGFRPASRTQMFYRLGNDLYRGTVETDGRLLLPITPNAANVDTAIMQTICYLS